MSGSLEHPTPYSNRKKKKPRKIDGKRVVRLKKKTQQLPRHRIVVSDGVVAVVEGYGVTEADLASARAMVLGIPVASTGGL
ncbi:hypothetical protein GBF35_25745 [Nonomuraea phyllanthi]|uniref:hypothetical protein n=1 Tax=Nonomuraea phyllanthi TaxID=2219224 RepID=UPI0012931E19|nr:hypothetical protein [Nonomuraea phyllanthi]QFY09603.1 hypothetical protein GBF35_25745 [Nonomuraea phyllanthi]